MTTGGTPLRHADRPRGRLAPTRRGAAAAQMTVCHCEGFVIN
jgi:hypothetical protein